MYILSYVLYIILEIISILIFLRVILSYIPMSPNKFTDFLVYATEPILEPVRMILAKFTKPGLFDWAPIVALLLITILQSLLRV